MSGKKKSDTFIMQSNLSTKATLGSEERIKPLIVERWPLVAVRLYFAMPFFSSPKEQFAALSSVLSWIFSSDPDLF